MIVLKVIGWILFAILAIIFVILVLPIRGEVSFIEKKLSYSARLWFIPVLNSQGGGILGWLKKRRSKKGGSDDDDDDLDDWYSGDGDFDAPADPITSEELDDLDSILDEGAVKEETEEETSQPVNQSEDTADTPKETAAEEVTPEEIPDSSENEESADNVEAEPDAPPANEEKTLGDKIEKVLDLWRAADRPVLKIFKGIHLSGVYIDFLIAHEDAYKCAMNYGTVSGTVYNLLGWLSVLFTVKFETVDVLPGFAQKESRYDAACKVTFRLGTVVIAGIAFLITYIFKYFIPNKLQNRKAKVR